jgi:hypothetical protein
MFRTSIEKEEDVDFWGLLNPKEKKIFGLYENRDFCPTLLRIKENNGHLRSRH